jgi:acetylornithine/succinyldiaminopimelate/putrescine aminotransferase
MPSRTFGQSPLATTQSTHVLKEPVSNKELVDQFKQLKTETTNLLAKLNWQLKVVEHGPKHKAKNPAPVNS